MKPDIYWLEGMPHGRLAILGRPRAHDWLVDEVAGWQAAGIMDVVSLLTDPEVSELGLQEEGPLVEARGLRFVSFPIPDRGVPASPLHAHQLWQALATRVRQGGAVGVHCRASIGRAGLIVAGTLRHLGLPEDLAWKCTSKARGTPVPDTPQQRVWLSEVWRAFQDQVPQA